MEIQKKEKIAVICPGRGSYNKTELGTLKKSPSHFKPFLEKLESYRRSRSWTGVTELDQASDFVISNHTTAENASGLIFACAVADFVSINLNRYDIVAVTGNSMGWYIALALTSVLSEQGGIEFIHTLANLGSAGSPGSVAPQKGALGGQLIYPVVNEQWLPDSGLLSTVAQALTQVQSQGHRVYPSIRFGGYQVMGGEEAGLAQLMKLLPPEQGRYPLMLVNHAAFHTPVLGPVSEAAFGIFKEDFFGKPVLPLVDGRGKIWQPYSTDPRALRDYTLGEQITDTFDFTAAIETTLKEFAPSKLVLLGPGTTLGGAIGQILVKTRWKGLSQKADFESLQQTDPFLLAMGREDQRAKVIA